MEHARKVDKERICKAPTHGKEGFIRFEGRTWGEEVVTDDDVREEEVGEVTDPRKNGEEEWVPPKVGARILRKEFVEVKYEVCVDRFIFVVWVLFFDFY